VGLIVVDASVAVKWILPEQDEQPARQLFLDGARFVAPATVRIEVAGAVLRRFREEKLPEAQAKSACDTWKEMIADGLIHLLPIEDLFDVALALAFKTKHALPDCLYLAAGKRLDAHVVTADRTLYERGKKIHGKMRLLDAQPTH